MSQSPAITPHVLESILAFLEPLFLAASRGDSTTARQAAQAMLDSYQPRTDRELRLAALAIAFGFGALALLAKSRDPALTPAQTMRLCGSANALNRSAMRNESQLDKLRRLPPAPREKPEALPASAAPHDLVSFAKSAARSAIKCIIRSQAAQPQLPQAAQPQLPQTAQPQLPHAAQPQLLETAASPAPAHALPLTRQQRRAAERQANKQSRREQEQARLAQRAEALRLARSGAAANA